MPKDNAVINPIKGKNSPNLGPVAVMVSNERDLHFLCRIMSLSEDNCSSLFMSRLYVGNGCRAHLSVVGPFIGAPYSVILLENLIAWGARKILFLGLCGAVSPNVKIGDIIVPTGSIIDEGTSKHYKGQGVGGRDQGLGNHTDDLCLVYPSFQIVHQAKAALKSNDLSFHEGVVWSTDAVYRETCEKVEYFQEKDVLAVEMESSALFTVGNFRKVELAGILVVSDELSTFKWRAGFKDKHFKKRCNAACEVISGLCKKL